MRVVTGAGLTSALLLGVCTAISLPSPAAAEAAVFSEARARIVDGVQFAANPRDAYGLDSTTARRSPELPGEETVQRENTMAGVMSVVESEAVGDLGFAGFVADPTSLTLTAYFTGTESEALDRLGDVAEEFPEVSVEILDAARDKSQTDAIIESIDFSQHGGVISVGATHDGGRLVVNVLDGAVVDYEALVQQVGMPITVVEAEEPPSGMADNRYEENVLFRGGAGYRFGTQPINKVHCSTAFPVTFWPYDHTEGQEVRMITAAHCFDYAGGGGALRQVVSNTGTYMGLSAGKVALFTDWDFAVIDTNKAISQHQVFIGRPSASTSLPRRAYANDTGTGLNTTVSLSGANSGSRDGIRVYARELMSPQYSQCTKACWMILADSVGPSVAPGDSGGFIYRDAHSDSQGTYVRLRGMVSIGAQGGETCRTYNNGTNGTCFRTVGYIGLDSILERLNNTTSRGEWTAAGDLTPLWWGS